MPRPRKFPRISSEEGSLEKDPVNDFSQPLDGPGRNAGNIAEFSV